MTIRVLQKDQTSKYLHPTARAQAPAVGENYQVELDKPYGLRFYKGTDGSTYVDALAPGQSAERSGMFTVGDKVLETSAVFGDDMWPAAEYGRTMYCIKNRSGPIIMKMQKNNGQKIAAFEVSDAYLAERKAGSLGDAVREKQVENYLRKKEQKEERRTALTDGLTLYKSGDYQGAMMKFETVLGLQPEPFELGVASYNVACCYAKLGQVETGLAALEAAMEAGFDDYKSTRTDPDLAVLRESEAFQPLLNKYDEPFINENALKAIGSFWPFGKK